MAPVQLKWFGFLSRTFPLTKTSSTVPALKRVAFDQLLFAPVGELSGGVRIIVAADDRPTDISSQGLAWFFTFMTLAEGGGKRAVARKFQDVYVPALKANYLVWPAVQILNFRVVPLQFQIVCRCPTDSQTPSHKLTNNSRSSLPSVSRGRHISLLPTQRRRWRNDGFYPNIVGRIIYAWFKRRLATAPECRLRFSIIGLPFTRHGVDPGCVTDNLGTGRGIYMAFCPCIDS